MAGLTIPEGDLWVNLSPYEKSRMVPEALGQTDLGRDLLAQDYILKQLTASLIYPEKDLGKAFWSRVYAKAQQEFGTTNVPVNTFNKVWILPDQAQVFEHGSAVYVTKATLKVMLDEDYTALQKHVAVRNGSDAIGASIVREIVIPEITKEVNTGKNFAPLRQIYQALILSKWYKETIQNGLLDALYTSKNKVAGINLSDPAVIKEQIYDRYLQAYKKGAFNYIKDDSTLDGNVVPRKYFSGGILPMVVDLKRDGAMSAVRADGAMAVLDVNLEDLAMNTVRKTITVKSKRGIHSRPATIMNTFAYHIYEKLGITFNIRNLRTNLGPFAVQSIWGVSSLGIKNNDKVEIIAHGGRNTSEVTLQKVLDLMEQLLQDEDTLERRKDISSYYKRVNDLAESENKTMSAQVDGEIINGLVSDDNKLKDQNLKELSLMKDPDQIHGILQRVFEKKGVEVDYKDEGDGLGVIKLYEGKT
jgi:phosphotransferase system HPr-like phosphotransfer protein